MSDLILFVLILGLILLVVTVVGHGIWVTVALIFGGSKPRQSLTDKYPTCPRCRTALQPDDHRCIVCHWPNALETGERRPEVLQAIQRQLDHYLRLGMVSPAAFERVKKILGNATFADPTPAVMEAEIVEATIVDQPAAAIEPTPAEAGTAEPGFTWIGEGTSEQEPIVKPNVEPVAQSTVAETNQTAAARAEQYAASRAASAPEPVPARRKPREALGNLLSAFLEEKNIRWGEIIGGLLIICCSTALVISFWSEIAARPILQFCIFNGVSAALFGIGFYTNRKWNIHTTSQGLLIISILLVPLNFLAIAAFTDRSPPTDLFSLGGEGLSLAIFSVLTFLGARTITPGNSLPATIGVMLPSLMQLLIRRFASEDAPLELMYALGAIPVAAYVGSSSIALRRQANRESLEEQSANRLFIFLGIVSYSLLLPLALLLFKSGNPSTALRELAPLLVFCGVPSLCTGLLFLRRISSKELAGIQTGGISVGVLGALIMLLGIVMAWPDPTTLLPTSLINWVTFALVAYWFRVPQLHLASALSGTMAWLVSFYLLRSDGAVDGGALTQFFLSATSGTGLTLLAASFGLVSYVCQRASRQDDAFWWQVSASVVASLSLLLVTFYGFGRTGDPFGVTWTYAFYTLVAAFAATRSKHGAVGWVASGLLLATLIQGTVFRYGTHLHLSHSVAIAFLLHATIAILTEFALSRLRDDRQPILETLRQTSTGTTTIAAAVLIAGAVFVPWTATAACSLWLAAAWCALAIRTGETRLLTAMQMALFASLCSAVTAKIETYAWYSTASRPWLDPWFLQAQGIAIGVYCLSWQAARHFILRQPQPTVVATVFSRLGQMLEPFNFDHICRIALLVLSVSLAIYASVPGIAQELWPLDQPALASRVVPAATQFELHHMPHSHAAGTGAWLLLLAAGAVMAAGLWHRGAAWSGAGLLFVAAATCPVIATWASHDVSVASALRWLLAAFALVASIGVWGRGRLEPGLRSLGIRVGDRLSNVSPNRFARASLVFLVVGTYIAMGEFVSYAALQKAGLPTAVRFNLPYLVVSFGLSLLFALLAYTNRNDHVGTENLKATATKVLVILTGSPLIIAMMFAVAAALRQHPLVAPEPDAWFREIGWSMSYGVPLFLFALTLVGYAIRDRASNFAYSAGLLFNLIATVVYLLELANAGRVLDRLAWIEVTQVNCVVCAAVTIIWTLAYRWHRSKAPSSPEIPPRLLELQLMLTIAVCTIPLVVGVVGLFLYPTVPSWVAAPGRPLGWVAMLSTFAAVAIWARIWFIGGLIPGRLKTSDDETVSAPQATFSIHHIAWTMLAAASILSLTVARYDTGNWLGYHTLLGCLAATAWVILWAQPVVTANSPLVVSNPAVVGQLPSQPSIRLHAGGRWCVVIGTLVVAMGIRALENDPAIPWWTLFSLFAMGTLAIALSWRAANRELVWVSAILTNIGAGIWWIDRSPTIPAIDSFASFADIRFVNVIVTALICLISVFIERKRIVPIARARALPVVLSFHRVATWGCIVLMLFLTTGGLIADLDGSPIVLNWLLASGALTLTALAACACFWDPSARYPVAGVYTVGLIATGMFLDSLNTTGQLFEWSTTLSFAAFALASSYAWSQRDKLANLAKTWHVQPTPALAENGNGGTLDGAEERETASGVVPPDSGEIGHDTRDSQSGHRWLVAANSMIAVVVALMVFRIELTFETFAQRLSASHAVLASAIALACLAHGTVRSALQRGSLILGALFAITFGFAFLALTIESPVLHRMVVAMVAIAFVIPLYGVGVVKVWREENEWTRAAQRLNPWLTAFGTVLLLNILGLEVAQYIDDRQVAILWPALLAVALALTGLTLFSLVAAVVPGRDPMGLSERGRTAYVYAAEALLALLFLHIRVTMPFLFSGWFIQFWPLIVMGIAFIGVGISEWCQRRQQFVLSKPLENTGALLPVLPVVGYWIVPSELHYSLVLLSVGSLYFALSFLRQSFTFAMLAVVACNGSLWFMLYSTNTLGLLQHPQLWLIPPAICVLVASHLNRSRLTEEQMTSTRYLSAIVIYASSTADVFVNGVGQAPWLPLVLAGLSILGIFAGILFKIRAFLFLGFAFLMVSLLTIIWHAAVELEMTWIWWVSGIVTGALIITLFGLFEKKRDEMLKLVERVGQWKP